jgi:hypothetical protein
MLFIKHGKQKSIAQKVIQTLDKKSFLSDILFKSRVKKIIFICNLILLK